MEDRYEGTTEHFATLMDLYQLNNSELEQQFQQHTKAEWYNEVTM